MKIVGYLFIVTALLIGVIAPSLSVKAENFCDQYKGVKKIWWNGIELKPGQIGRLIVKENTPLYKVSSENRTYSRTLKAGDFYRIYAFKPGMLSVGGGYYVNRDERVTYQTPSKTKLAAVGCIHTGYADVPMKVHFINAGQGDSILINFPNGKTMLVDGGKRDAEDTVGNYLRKVGVKSLDLVVATHPEAEHIGGLIDVLNFFPVSMVLENGKGHYTQPYLDLLSVIHSKNIPLVVAQLGQTLNLDANVKITVLHSGEVATDYNNPSLSLKISYGTIDILLTGDAVTEQEEHMMARFNVGAEIFKAANHGSKSGNSLEFLQEVLPDATVLSYGKDNSCNQPNGEVITRLQQIDSTIYSTADSGNIVFTVTKSAFTVSANPWSYELWTSKLKKELNAYFAEMNIGVVNDVTLTRLGDLGQFIVTVKGDYPANFVHVGDVIYHQGGNDQINRIIKENIPSDLYADGYNYKYSGFWGGTGGKFMYYLGK